MSRATLGPLLVNWIYAHCTIPDGDRKGKPYELYRWQYSFLMNHYEVNSDALPSQDGPAFRFRRSQLVSPQKSGKSPFAAAIVCAEALGPVLFDGFAEAGEVYRCSEHGCFCGSDGSDGFTHTYKEGEPKGRAWATPLIQLVATSEEQVANSFRPLQVMLRAWPDSGRAKVSEQFVRLPNDGRIESVTSSATARLGNPITFVSMDETHLYTRANKLIRMSETMRRGVAGMGGRSLEITNAWDPAEMSVAQRTSEAKALDIYRQHVQAPAGLSYGNKAERRKIHKAVYAGSTHVDLGSIEAEAAELIETDPAQAERFFGNRIVQGHGAWLADGLWERSAEGFKDG